MTIRFRSLVIILGILSQVTGCSQSNPTPVVIPLQDTVIERPLEEWQVASPESQGMDSEVLAAMLETVQEEHYAIDSITIVRNGYLILDAAVFPYDQNKKHITHSCTKSIVSILIGITIDQGYIKNVQTPISEIFPDRTIKNMDENKEMMTLEHLLTMTTGMKCQDSYLYRWTGLSQMRQTDDWIQYVLDLPMANEPGTRFEYCNGASFLLSAIITETTGMNANEFADENLFKPLGITDINWPANPQGINIGWGELRMLPHDMAKIGFLYLQEGKWNGSHIVSSSWVKESTQSHISATLEDGYGYQWWVDDSGVYMALGYAGQFIFVVPEEDLVVVFLSDLAESDFYTPQILLFDYIIPAAISPEPLEKNPAGEELLKEQIEELSNPTQSETD